MLVVGCIFVVFMFGVGFWAGYAMAYRNAGALWKHGYNLGASNTHRGLRKSREAISVLIYKRRRARMTV